MTEQSGSKGATPPGVSRRFFLKSVAGVSAIAGAAVSHTQIAQGEPQDAVLGPGPVPLRFRLNGAAVTTSAEPADTLATVLLFKLDKTGTKLGCGRGACGACTVLVEGRPRASCLAPALDVEGLAVETVEGLAQGSALHPLQESFAMLDALQCGYCTPGFLMSAAALLRSNPQPSREAVSAALDGNLCRCGSHPHIVEAVLRAAQRG
jgi:aerobic-type carbon monoxide dehydrogenase small subunit (CoxS/CutS family)